MILAAGQGVSIVIAAAYADQLIYLIVVWFYVFVLKGPGNAVAVVDFEIYVGIAQRNASPHVRFAAMSPHAIEVISLAFGRQIRLFFRTQKTEFGLLTFGI